MLLLLLFGCCCFLSIYFLAVRGVVFFLLLWSVVCFPLSVARCCLLPPLGVVLPFPFFFEFQFKV